MWKWGLELENLKTYITKLQNGNLLNIVAGKSKASSNDLTDTEPCV